MLICGFYYHPSKQSTFLQCPTDQTIPLGHQTTSVQTHLAVEIQEPVLTVDVPEGGKALDRAIHTHGVVPQLSSDGHEQPVRIWTTDKHLQKTGRERTKKD